MTAISQTNTSTTAAAGATATKATTVSKEEAATQSLNANFDMFLKLLTTQMKNQDPLKPQDPNEMANQLVQYSNVEQNIATNSYLKKILELQEGNRATAALSYIGKSVVVEDNKLPLQNGKGTFFYETDKVSADTAVTIRDSTGTIVRNIKGETTAGRHVVAWDGKDDQGNTLSDGVYTISVKAEDEKKNPLTVTTSVSGTVGGIEVDDSRTLLSIGPLIYDLERVIAIQ